MVLDYWVVIVEGYEVLCVDVFGCMLICELGGVLILFVLLLFWVDGGLIVEWLLFVGFECDGG